MSRNALSQIVRQYPLLAAPFFEEPRALERCGFAGLSSNGVVWIDGL